jgi:uncharacterized protein (TIGR03663 family)
MDRLHGQSDAGSGAPYRRQTQASDQPLSSTRTRRGERIDPPLAASPGPVATAPVEPTLTNRASAAVAAASRRAFTLETALWALLVILAFGTRFWDLGARAMHHDETLHAYYSWKYTTGEGYQHLSLTHGPLLFHFVAFIFLIFGDSDATARYMPAICGVVLVWLPYLLRGRRLLGRWGALSAGALILVSPTITYYSRNLRHDMFTLTGTMLLFICIVRYLDRPARRWLITGGITTGLLLTNHEVFYAILGIFVIFLYTDLLWNRLRVWVQTRPTAAYAVLGVHVAAIVLVLALAALTPASAKHSLLDIPWNNPTPAQERGYYHDVIRNPLIIGIVLIVIGFIVALWAALNRARDPQRSGEGWLASLLGDAPQGSIGAAVLAAGRDRSGLGIAIASVIVIWVALFTSLLSNLRGLWTSTFATNGTLLYWLGQHDYRRGDQPWFYYLVLLPQYEYLPVLLGVTAIVVTLWRTGGVLFGRPDPGSNLRFRLFLVTWALGIFAGLSYAGEKMPWLVLHIALPLTLLAAALIGGLIERALATRRLLHARGRPISTVGWPEWGVLAVLLIAAASWLVLAGRLTDGQFAQSAEGGNLKRTLTANSVDHWWWMALPPLVAFLALAVGQLWHGPWRTGQAALAALLIGVMALQIHAGWRMTYLEGDVPKDMLIYTQTSPDVVRVMNEIDQLSYELTGGKDMEIWYDGVTAWPFQWYLRDFPNKHYFVSSLTEPPDNAPIVLVGDQNVAGVENALQGYTGQEYVMRWWFPEDETYRHFAIAPELQPGQSAWTSPDQPHGPVAVLGSIGDSLEQFLTPGGQQQVYRLAMYRDLPAPIGQFRFRIYIRNDLLPFYNELRY